MAPERVGHGKVKFAVQTALVQGIRKAGLRCHMLPDGATVRVSAACRARAGRPGVLRGGVAQDAIEVPEPVIVVEVASPSTRKVDASLKLTGYFSLPSVQHYLIVDPDGPPVIHHRRQGDGDDPDHDRARRRADFCIRLTGTPTGGSRWRVAESFAAA